jgi:hypothetical protein
MKKYEGYTMSVDTALGMMIGGNKMYIYTYTCFFSYTEPIFMYRCIYV